MNTWLTRKGVTPKLDSHKRTCTTGLMRKDGMKLLKAIHMLHLCICNQRGILKYFHLNDNKSPTYPNLGYMIKAELGRGRFRSLFAYSRDG